MKYILMIVLTLNAFSSSITAIAVDGRKKVVSNIQNALDFVHQYGGGDVQLSAGEFIVKEQLKIYDNIILQGSLNKNGELATTIKVKDPINLNLSKLPPIIVNEFYNRANSSSYNHHIIIKNLKIDGSSKEEKKRWSLGSGNATIINFLHVKDIKLKNLNIQNSLDDAIFIKDGENINISNSIIKNSGHSGVFIVESNNTTVQGMNIDINVNSGIRFFGGDNIVIKDNRLYSTSGYGNYGIQVSQAYSEKPMNHLLIQNNIIRNTPYAGVALYASRGKDIAKAIIQNNIIEECGAKAPNLEEFPKTIIEEAGGINIQYFQSVVIKNNILQNNYGSAISIDNRFYSSDVNFDELEKIKREVVISNNKIIGSHSDKKAVYGIEKHSDSSNLKVTIKDNFFEKNQNGNFSPNLYRDLNNSSKSN